MTKTETQSALAEATQTDKKTAGVFLDTLSAIAYKGIKETVEFVLPGFGKLVKQKRKARTGFNPKTQQKINSSQDPRQNSCWQGRKGRGFGGKEVVKELTQESQSILYCSTD
jgi:DNA-binding protein HU-beta